MARKKVVFVIVEGKTDEDALGLFFNRIYDENLVYIKVIHGDLTTMEGDIKNRIADKVRTYAGEYHLLKSDFQEIIHIVDMDGSYISDDDVIEDDSMIDPFYDKTKIRTCDPSGIRKRNAKKRKNVDIISSMPAAWGGVPYQAYFMSCNLDHVLHNKQNSNVAEKAEDAHKFAKKYKDNVDEFLNFISDSDFSVQGSYLETWAYIKKGNHSLERHTNLGLCFKRALVKTNKSD